MVKEDILIILRTIYGPLNELIADNIDSLYGGFFNIANYLGLKDPINFEIIPKDILQLIIDDVLAALSVDFVYDKIPNNPQNLTMLTQQYTAASVVMRYGNVLQIHPTSISGLVSVLQQKCNRYQQYDSIMFKQRVGMEQQSCDQITEEIKRKRSRAVHDKSHGTLEDLLKNTKH